MRTSMKSVICWVVIGILSMLGVFGVMFSPAHAASGSPTPKPALPTSAPTALPASPSDQYCFLCHSRANLTTQLPSGDSLYLTIDPAAFSSSIHGKASPAIHCVSCHTTITILVLTHRSLRKICEKSPFPFRRAARAVIPLNLQSNRTAFINRPWRGQRKCCRMFQTAITRTTLACLPNREQKS